MIGQARWRTRCGAGAAGALVALVACTNATELQPQDQGGSSEPAPTELLPTFIHRLPEMDFVVQSSNPTRDGWPTPGQEVTWRAHVRKIGGEAGPVPYAWTLDGDTLATGSVTVSAGSTATVDFPWTWTFDRHVLGFVVDPDHSIHEENEYNNTLDVYTDALSLGIWVEQRFYDFYRDHISEVSGTESSFEDWLQAHVSRLNSLFAAARYPETPDGVLDRVRLDKIAIVPDGSLGPPSSTHHPAPDDHTVDLEYSFESYLVDHLGPPTGSRAKYSPVFGYRGAFLHELGHARYLIDVYLWNLIDGWFGNRIGIEEGGAPLLGSKYLPLLGPQQILDSDTLSYVFDTPEQGLMNTNYDYVDRYSAIALNLIAHQRPLYDNFNCPANCGAYMLDLPKENVLELTDTTGAPLGGASVEIYRSGWRIPSPLDPDPTVLPDYFDDVPDFTATADATGAVAVGTNPFGIVDEHSTDIWSQEPRRHVIIRVEKDGRIGYAILESRLFNLAYWRGDTELARYPVEVKLFDPT